jgi:hypothetical protein
MLDLIGKRRVLWDPVITEGAPIVGAPSPSLEQFQASLSGPTVVGIAEREVLIVQPKPTRNYKQRIGNGHVAAKSRKLTDEEKNKIRKWFILKSGIIESKDCAEFRVDCFPPEITIWQITGFVSLLHNEAAEGLIWLVQALEYAQWLKEKQGALWGRWNNPQYVKVRHANLAAYIQGKPQTLRVSKKIDIWIRS